MHWIFVKFLLHLVDFALAFLEHTPELLVVDSVNDALLHRVGLWNAELFKCRPPLCQLELRREHLLLLLSGSQIHPRYKRFLHFNWLELLWLELGREFFGEDLDRIADLVSVRQKRVGCKRRPAAQIVFIDELNPLLVELGAHVDLVRRVYHGDACLVVKLLHLVR